jgi:hypothetical protein
MDLQKLEEERKNHTNSQKLNAIIQQEIIQLRDQRTNDIKQINILQDEIQRYLDLDQLKKDNVSTKSSLPRQKSYTRKINDLKENKICTGDESIPHYAHLIKVRQDNRWIISLHLHLRTNTHSMRQKPSCYSKDFVIPSDMVFFISLQF